MGLEIAAHRKPESGNQRPACRGASDQSRSEGSMQELSAMTASADLEMIVSELLQSGEFDADRVVLAGASLGGFHGPAQKEALLYIRQYLERIGVKDLPAGPEA